MVVTLGMEIVYLHSDFFAQFRTKDGGVCKRPSYYGWDKRYKCILEDKLDVMLKQMQSV